MKSPTSEPVGAMVSHVARLDDEDDVFGDVGGVVADALEVPGDENEIDAGFDGARIAEHVGEQFADDLTLQRIELIVALEHLLGGADIADHEGVERFVEHLLSHLAHARQIDERLHG